MLLFSIRRHCRSLACVAAPLALLALSGCGSWRNTKWSSPETLFGLIQPYQIDVVQGNVVTQEVMAQIQPGLGRTQVREILGSPLLADAFHADRWDYVFSIRRQGVPAQQRRVTVFFKDDMVERFEADPLPSEREFVASIDKPTVLKPVVPNLTDAEMAALPIPPKTDATRKAPLGAVRAYPPLEAGRP
ncbi:MAG: outer membrane protein assembly factor BamE [Burkholderiales bacterium]|nr:outer membrane protein assembly factor BamE [Burkholderiales bacterium]